MKDWEQWFLHHGEDFIKTDTRGNVVLGFFIEGMYQAFKERLIDELETEHGDRIKSSNIQY